MSQDFQNCATIRAKRLLFLVSLCVVQATAIGGEASKRSEPVYIPPALKGKIYLYYPKRAADMGMSGTAMAEIVVTASGKAKDIRLVQSSGWGLLDFSATNSPHFWTFAPARRNKRACEATVRQRFEFRPATQARSDSEYDLWPELTNSSASCDRTTAGRKQAGVQSAETGIEQSDKCAQVPVTFSSAGFTNWFAPFPFYPRSALLQFREGKLLLLVRWSKQGYPQDVEVRQSSGHPDLDLVAVATVFERWKRLDESPEEIFTLIPVVFKIDR